MFDDYIPVRPKDLLSLFDFSGSMYPIEEQLNDIDAIIKRREKFQWKWGRMKQKRKHTKDKSNGIEYHDCDWRLFALPKTVACYTCVCFYWAAYRQKKEREPHVI